MSKNKVPDMKCGICRRSEKLIFNISSYYHNIKRTSKTLCPTCMMADILSIYEIIKINFPEQAAIIEEMKNIMLKHKKEKDPEFLKKAAEIASKDEIASKEGKSDE